MDIKNTFVLISHTMNNFIHSEQLNRDILFTNYVDIDTFIRVFCYKLILKG